MNSTEALRGWALVAKADGVAGDVPDSILRLLDDRDAMEARERRLTDLIRRMTAPHQVWGELHAEIADALTGQ